MPSAVVKIIGKSGSDITCRVLLDTRCIANFITENLCNKLKLTKSPCSLTITAMNNLNTTANYLTDVTFRSIHSEFKKSLTCFVVKEITNLIPKEPVPRNRLRIPKHLKLADPHFENQQP
ncbi:hypothetical protein TSAR_004063 [Trichomalopsis sarcophagae]|uniref:Uncharacterized protein n=1 Tax=Trichomalopsis sarcophagae TaxID=543379 RepID=A0A232F1H5_9HYME|nr:hypothetical protein TSAR_004063 [Trichomalopsis sarcophagae]